VSLPPHSKHPARRGCHFERAQRVEKSRWCPCLRLNGEIPPLGVFGPSVGMTQRRRRGLPGGTPFQTLPLPSAGKGGGEGRTRPVQRLKKLYCVPNGIKISPEGLSRRQADQLPNGLGAAFRAGSAGLQLLENGPKTLNLMPLGTQYSFLRRCTGRVRPSPRPFPTAGRGRVWNGVPPGKPRRLRWVIPTEGRKAPSGGISPFSRRQGHQRDFSTRCARSK